MRFAPLHTKSEFSHGEGTGSVEDLVRRAVGEGYPALALTDVENLYGQVQFHHAARAQGLRPITGVELRSGFAPADPGRRPGRLVLLARDQAGYESLCRILTARRTGAVPTPDPLRCLDAFPAGLFYLSDDPEVIRRLRADGVAVEDLRFLVGGREPAAPVPGVRAVADPDIVLLDPLDADLHRLAASIRQRCRVAAVSSGEFPPESFPDAEEAGRRFGRRPELLEESVLLAEQCTLDLTGGAPILPSGGYSDPAEAQAVLAARCRESLPAMDRERRERLDAELVAIGDRGLAGYFLTVAEIAGYARSRGIPLASRGSAAGSLTAHLLGLSAVDPLEQGLFFERFLDPDREDLPDIDLDIASDRRDEVLDWVFGHFGEGRVAMIASHQTFGRRAAFREGLKAYGMELAAVDRFIQAFPAGELEGDATGPLPLHLLPARLRPVAPLIERLVGKPRHLSVHPGGVVLAESRVDLHAPLERSPKGVPVTQYDMTSVARLGLIKIDLLGNQALAAQAESIRQLGGRVSMPDFDGATVDTLRSGNTIGCFQIETPVTRSVLKRLPVRGTADLMAALAIVRPGPGAGSAKLDFIRRANGESSREAAHPLLAERLRATFGMMLYDEDVMAAIAALTRWPLSAADGLRTGLIDSAPGSPARLSLKRRFLVAASHAGVARGDGERVWQMLERFAAHSFCKAHAASHARLAWESAYLKTHHTAAFACGVLNHYGGHYPLRAVASDLVRCGVVLRAPHVNRSGAAHHLEEDGSVRLGLSAVKCLTTRSRERILAGRPFPDLRSLITRIQLTAAELESLILSGACDDLAPLAGSAYPFPHEELLTRWKREPGLRGLDGFVARNARGSFADTHRVLARIRNELRFLGMHPSAHPMGVLRAEAAREGCVTTPELADHLGEPVRVAAVVAASRRHPDRSGRILQFVTLEDEYGLTEAVLSPGVVAALQGPVSSPGPLLVTGRMQDDGTDPQLSVTEVTPFHLRTAPYQTAESV